MCELFSINALCCTSGDIDNNDCTGVGDTYFTCGKVNICRNGKLVIGYVLEESSLLWNVQLITREVVSVRQYNNKLNAYNYSVNSKLSNEMIVEDFDPVWIKIYKIGKQHSF